MTAPQRQIVFTRYLSQGATGGDRHFRIRSFMLRIKADHPQRDFAFTMALTIHLAILLDGAPGRGSGPTKVEMCRVMVSL